MLVKILPDQFISTMIKLSMIMHQDGLWEPRYELEKTSLGMISMKMPCSWMIQLKLISIEKGEYVHQKLELSQDFQEAIKKLIQVLNIFLVRSQCIINHKSTHLASEEVRH